MARVQDNAQAEYVVLAWDGTNPGVVAGFDNEAEAMDDATRRKNEAPEHVDYYVCSQQGLREKVSELTGTPIEAIADPNQTLPEGFGDVPAGSSDDE